MLVTEYYDHNTKQIIGKDEPKKSLEQTRRRAQFFSDWYHITVRFRTKIVGKEAASGPRSIAGGLGIVGHG